FGESSASAGADLGRTRARHVKRAASVEESRRSRLPTSSRGCVAALPLTSAGVLFRAAYSDFQPQLVTSRMEVCFARCRLGWVERVKVKCSEVTRGADAARPFALLLCRDRAAHGVGEPRAELCFNPGALGAQTICPKFGNRVADSADQFVDCSVFEEAKTCCGHLGSS